MNASRFTFCILLAVLLCSTGCCLVTFYPTEIFARHSNPIAGWREVYTGEPNKTISDDYHDYTNKMREKKKDVGSVHYFEDGKGQHAIQILEQVDGICDGTWWQHVLIYDKNDKRIKVVKYVYGHFGEW